jgi:hypothetical protein
MSAAVNLALKPNTKDTVAASHRTMKTINALRGNLGNKVK